MVTKPSPAMREAMANAAVGDDVLGDDPTVIALQERTADLFGKEAGLFVPSGTMGNQVALASWTRPGDEVLAEEWSHTLNFECGAAAALFGVLTRSLRSDRGRLDPGEVAGWIRPGDLHMPRTAVLAVENTHNFHGGAVVPMENLVALRGLTAERDVRLHIDGARIWNAAAATGAGLSEYGALCDSLSVCLSKGLGAPVGSVVMGTGDMIDRARVVRQRLGGGMRQSGVIAAAGIVAVDTMRERLPEDHANARRFAEGMAGIDGLVVDLDVVETNIVFVRVTKMPAADFVAALHEKQVWTYDFGPDTCRFVTHADVDAEDVDRALEVMGGLLR